VLVARWESLAGLGLPLVALLAAAAVAFVFDDAAAAVTSVAPRGARWARGARAAVAVVPLALATAVLSGVPRDLRGDRTDWVLVVAALGAVVLAAALVGAARQVPRPGGPLAPAVVLAGMAPLVVGLFLDLRSPYPVPGLTADLRLFWSAALGAGVLGTAALLAGGGRP